MTTASNNQPLLPNQLQVDDQINLQQVAGALRRRWRWILGGGAIGLLFSGFQLTSTKPVYMGEFQIVLSSGKTSTATSLLAKNPGLASLAALGGVKSKDSIATEVQILKSPSVLRPVFEAVKARKPPEVAKAMRFQYWAKSVTTRTEKGTSVLNVEYRDTDKQLVLPITRMISQAYQSYSYRGPTREISNAIDYLEEQIKQIKPKSQASLREALDYGFANGLGLLDGLPLAGNVSGAGVSKPGSSSVALVAGNGGGFEAARTTAQQRMLLLNTQILAAKKAGDDSIYFASQLDESTDLQQTLGQLTDVETRLAELRSRFKDTDPLVQKLLRQRKTLVSYINQQTISMLNGELVLAKAALKGLDRPKEVVNRHRELTQEALRNEATLVTLQNQLKQFQLQQARTPNPWELISTPSMLENPVSPRRSRTLALGLLTGMVLGSGSALIRDRSSNRVFNTDELSRDLPGPLLERLPCSDVDQPVDAWHTPIQLLADGPLAGEGSVALIPVGSIAPDVLDAFTRSLRQSLGENRKLVISRDLLTTRTCSTQLLLTAPGAAKREQLRQLREQLALQGTPVVGSVLFDSSLDA